MAVPDVTSRDDTDVDLRVYLALLRRRWLAIVGTLIGFVAIAMALTMAETPTYRARLDILLEDAASPVFDSEQTNAQQARRHLNNEQLIFESPKVRAAVDAVYDGPLNVRAVRASSASADSDRLTASIVATDPDAATELLDVYVATFLEVRRTDRLDQLLAVSTQIEERIASLTAQIDALRAPLTSLDEELSEDPDNEALQRERAETEAELAIELDPLFRQRSAYTAQVEELGVSRDIFQLGNVMVLGDAEASSRPVSPQPTRNLAVALAIGLLAGLGLAVVRDTLDDRIRGTGDVEELTDGRPSLAVVPFHREHRTTTFVATRDDARSIQAEAYRTLRTAIRFASIDSAIKVIQVTSPNQGEGKTTTAANLAVAFAQAGERVLIICCDLRRPRVHERFDVGLEPGFTDVLVGDVQPVQVINQMSSLPLGVLTAGSPPPNPSELLSNPRAEAVIRTAAGTYDVVIIDSTPILPVTDAIVVSRMADAVIVVADGRSTSRNDLREAATALIRAQAPVLGVVLNGVRRGAMYHSGYGQGYIDAPPRRRRVRRGAHERDVDPVAAQTTTDPVLGAASVESG